MQQRRVVITGLGVLAPNGCRKEVFWQACLQGCSGIRTLTHLDPQILPSCIAGIIPDFIPERFGVTSVECKQLDRSTQLALAAAHLALEDARLNATQLRVPERERIGVSMGTAMASVEAGERLWVQLTDGGAHSPHLPFQKSDAPLLMFSYNPAGVIATHYRLRGPCLTMATGCSAGADAIGQAFWHIQEGRAERMLAGGNDSALSLLGLSVFHVMHALSTHHSEPTRASRPYESNRDGFVLSEGAAVLLLEEREMALARGAHIYAEIVSFVSNSNAYHLVTLPGDGTPLHALFCQALETASLLPQQLGYINSHGSSTRANDVIETLAYKRAFGSHAYHIPISATKSVIGHAQGAASAIEVLVTALALEQQILPPTTNLEVPDPCCDLDYVPHHARQVNACQPLSFALTHSSGFGGVNTALILARKDACDQEASCSPSQVNPYLVPAGRKHVFSSSLPSRRVVITGVGVVAPNGIGKEAFWQALCSGSTVMMPLERGRGEKLPPRLVGEVKDFHAEEYLDRKMLRTTDRMTHFVFPAAQEALQNSELELEQENAARIGAVIANTLGGVEYVTQQLSRLYQLGPRFISAHTALAWFHAANIGHLSAHYDLGGYCKVPVSDTCGGLDALGLAFQAIRRGTADVLIAGGTEAPLHPCSLHSLDLLSSFQGGNDRWEETSSTIAYRPFDLRANGLLIAEGAGICILEAYEHALQRDAPLYGEIVGFAQTCAPLNLATPTHPDADAYIRALHIALAEAHMQPEDIACVFLDGRALPGWDASESTALRTVFGQAFDTLPCSVPRTQFGHSLAAAGVLDTICAVLTLRRHLLPPTVNCEQPDPQYCPPGLVREGMQVQDSYPSGCLICARGLSGNHSILAIKQYEGKTQ